MNQGSAPLNVDGTLFTFAPGVQAEQFDEWDYYKRLSSNSIRGCDVVALQGKTLWLIEVKDYTYPNAQGVPDLEETLVRKFVGTMGVLYALQRAPQDSAPIEFSRACAKATTIRLALHIELKPGKKDIAWQMATLQDDLRKAMKPLNVAGFRITSSQVKIPNVPWTAERDPETRDKHVSR